VEAYAFAIFLGIFSFIVPALSVQVFPQLGYCGSLVKMGKPLPSNPLIYIGASPYRSNGVSGKCREFGQGNLNTNGVRAVNLRLFGFRY
jgi:hypothetical protein